MGGITVTGSMDQSNIRAEQLTSVNVIGTITGNPGDVINASNGGSWFTVRDATQYAVVNALTSPVFFENVAASVGP